MYLDFSKRKLTTIGIIFGLLALLVFATYSAKMNLFGSTPYFYAINIGGRYFLESVGAGLGNTRMFAAASSALGLGGDIAPETSDRRAPALPVLTYHRIVSDENDENNVTISRFRDQMTTLYDAGWHAITLPEFERFMAGSELPERSFLITFDDGAKQSFYPVDPILKSLGMNASIFVIAESSKTAESTYYLTPEELKRLLSTGRWSIGSHSYDGHRPYGTDPSGNTGIFFADKLWIKDSNRAETDQEFTARVRNDLAHSRAELESTYGVPINTFAFPLGNETGVEGANNFPEGATITEREARALYDWGFLQTNDQGFTFNFPKYSADSPLSSFATTSQRLASDFIVRRIHVDYDWDGARLLSILENGLAKMLPYEDDFSQNRGWISAWGSLEYGRNNLTLAADPEITSASAFLDGSALWDDYSFEASINWEGNHVLLIADVLDSKTYHSCAFSEGTVRIQRTVDGMTHFLQEKKDPRIRYGSAAHLGIRVHDSVIECTWDFESIVEDYSRDFSGGVGLQVWNPNVGAARLQVSSLIVRPYTR